MTEITNLVLAKDKRLHKTTKVEVLTFVTEQDFNNCNEEQDFKKHIKEKFRNYDHACLYAQQLAIGSIYYAKILVRA